MAAPSCMETLKRQAVLRKMRSKYSSSLMRWPSFCIWSSSPSTICWVSEMSRSRTRKLRSSRASGEGLHVEPVAGEDALGVAPGGVGGGAAAAGVGFVDDVVVDEGGGVEHLDDGAEADARVGGAAEGFGGEQQQQRADALAAAGHEVVRDVGDDFDVGGGLAGELLLDGGEVVAEEVEDLFCSRDGEGAHSTLE